MNANVPTQAMQFNPPKQENTFVTSAATVTILEGGKVRICYLDKFDKQTKEVTKKVNFSDGEKCKIFEFSELPVQFDEADAGAEIILRVKSEGKKIVEFLPENEVGLEGRFVEFYRVNGKDTNPIPVEAKKFKDSAPDVLQFSAIFRIEGGMFDGKTVTDFLQFHQSGISKAGNPYSYPTFTVDASGNVSLGFQPLPDGTTGYNWSNKIYDLRHCGLLEGSPMQMPEDGNPLLLIEQKLQKANKLVKLDIEKGYVAAISSAKKMKAVLAKPPVEVVENLGNGHAEVVEVSDPDAM